jgi:hypothetical protein
MSASDAAQTSAPSRSLLGRLEDLFGAEVSSRSLGLVRIVVGLMIWEQFTSPWCGHRMDDHAGTLVLAWIVLLGVWLVIWGLWTRFATVAVALAFAGIHLYYGVHLDDAKLADPILEFQLVALLALTPCGRSLSIDRALELRRAKNEGRPPRPERAPWWTLELFLIVVASMFFWLGWSSLDDDWLSGAFYERLVLHWYGSDVYAAHPRLPSLLRPAAWLTTVLEFGVALGLILRPLRVYAMWVAFVLMFVNWMLFGHSYESVWVFVVPLTPLVACIPPDKLEALVADQTGAPLAKVEAAEADDAGGSVPSWVTRLVVPLAAFAAVLAWSNVPPYRGHVKGQERDLFVWTWALYEPIRSPVCDLRYYDMNAGGEELERWTVLGKRHPSELPGKWQRVRASQLGADQTRVCEAKRAAGDLTPNLELEARCLSGEGWKDVSTRERGNVCLEAPKAVAKPKRRPSRKGAARGSGRARRDP